MRERPFPIHCDVDNLGFKQGVGAVQAVGVQISVKAYVEERTQLILLVECCSLNRGFLAQQR